MHPLYIGKQGLNLKLYALRRRIVERLERNNEAADIPEYWKMVGPNVQVGKDVGRRRVWRTVPFLSVELLNREREIREWKEADLPMFLRMQAA